jgi:hypothetical protein
MFLLLNKILTILIKKFTICYETTLFFSSQFLWYRTHSQFREKNRWIIAGSYFLCLILCIIHLIIATLHQISLSHCMLTNYIALFSLCVDSIYQRHLPRDLLIIKKVRYIPPSPPLVNHLVCLCYYENVNNRVMMKTCKKFK